MLDVFEVKQTSICNIFVRAEVMQITERRVSKNE